MLYVSVALQPDTPDNTAALVKGAPPACAEWVSPGGDQVRTGTGRAMTVTFREDSLSPALAWTAASPAAIAFTRPVGSTVTLVTSVLLHVTFLSVASAGATVAMSCLLSPTFKARSEVTSRETPVTATFLSLSEHAENKLVKAKNDPKRK